MAGMPDSVRLQAHQDYRTALQLIAEKGRCYRNQGKYTIIRVFSRDRHEAILLHEVFGGSFTHRSPDSYIWTCGRTPTLLLIRRDLPQTLLTTKFRRLLDVDKPKPIRHAA